MRHPRGEVREAGHLRLLFRPSWIHTLRTSTQMLFKGNNEVGMEGDEDQQQRPKSFLAQRPERKESLRAVEPGGQLSKRLSNGA